jgi:hypothetical protein
MYVERPTTFAEIVRAFVEEQALGDSRKRDQASCAFSAVLNSSIIIAQPGGETISTASPQVNRCQDSSRMPLARKVTVTEPSGSWVTAGLGGSASAGRPRRGGA